VEEAAVDRRNGHRPELRAEALRISQVLAGLRYPAAKWQVLAEADHYGADVASRAQLWTLPAGTYADLSGVLGQLGLLEPGATVPAQRRRLRSVPRPRR
jgi:hypothetical protein